MRTSISRVVLLSFLFVSSVSSLAYCQGRGTAPFVRAKESSARLVLKEKSSIFSIELSANAANPVPATFTAKILAPDDKLLAEASVPVRLSSVPRRVEVPLKWVPDSGLQGVSNSRLIYEVRLE